MNETCDLDSCKELATIDCPDCDLNVCEKHASKDKKKCRYCDDDPEWDIEGINEMIKLAKDRGLIE